MLSFVDWCKANDLPLFTEESAKAPMRGAKKVSYKDKVDGARAGQEDLDDYEGHKADNGTVEPFKLKGKGKGKAVAK